MSSNKDDDAFKYWQSKLKSGEKAAGKAKAADSDDDSDEQLDEDFSGSEVKFSEPDDDGSKDDEYSMNDDDDFAISSSFKQMPQSKTTADATKASGGSSAAQ